MVRQLTEQLNVLESDEAISERSHRERACGMTPKFFADHCVPIYPNKQNGGMYAGA